MTTKHLIKSFKYTENRFNIERKKGAENKNKNVCFKLQRMCIQSKIEIYTILI